MTLHDADVLSDAISANTKRHYYLKKYVALSIRKTINAVTVMLAVMKIIQQIMNAVTVIPVKMYQTISKHIMFRCHCRFLLEI